MIKITWLSPIAAIWCALAYLSIPGSTCPLTNLKSYSYLYNGTCYSAVLSSSLPKMENDNFLQQLDKYCRNTHPSARLATLIVGEELQMPPPEYWVHFKDHLSFLVGSQVDTHLEEQSNSKGKDVMRIFKHLIGVSSDYVNVHPNDANPDSAYAHRKLLCPVVLAKRHRAKYTIKLVNCASKSKWDMFFCKSPPAPFATFQANNSFVLPQVDISPSRMCEYDKVRRRCFLRPLVGDSNSLESEASRLCRCTSCTLHQWTQWGPWSSICGQAQRFRLRAKDGEEISLCIEDQTRCCVEMESSQLPGCTADDRQIQVITDCLNGGIPVDMGEGRIVCSCKRNFTGALCEKRRVRRTTGMLLQEFFKTRKARSASDKCDGNPCDCRPCRNGGTCKDIGNGRYECICHSMFFGRTCENLKSKPCDNVICKNGGYCVGDRDSFTCICQKGYMGELCETEAQPCKGNLFCLNGGTCHSNGTYEKCQCLTGFTGQDCSTYLLNQDCNAVTCVNGDCVLMDGRTACKCKNGFEGIYCASQADMCLSNPCLNDGVCESHVGGFRCICPERYVGLRCEQTVSPCGSSPCLKGICSRSGDGYVCSCYPGYEGNNCQAETNECLSDPCQNGGACEDLINGYKCHCKSGYTGPNCAYAELVKGSSSQLETDYVIPVAIFLSLLLLAIVGLLMYIYQDRFYRATVLSGPKAAEKHEPPTEVDIEGRSSLRRSTMQKVAEFLAALGWGKSSDQSESKRDSDAADKAKEAGQPPSGQSPAAKEEQSEKERKKKSDPSPSSSERSSLKSPAGRRSGKHKPKSLMQKSRTPKSHSRSPASDRERKSPSRPLRSRKFIYKSPVPPTMSPQQDTLLLRMVTPSNRLPPQGQSMTSSSVQASSAGKAPTEQKSPQVKPEGNEVTSEKTREKERNSSGSQRGSKSWWKIYKSKQTH
uniref:EGF-like domain-containing protein n=1 Tax=Trichuris muris TaxID=70415 RepID=A0A5S6PYS1_TRIMR